MNIILIICVLFGVVVAGIVFLGWSLVNNLLAMSRDEQDDRRTGKKP